MDTYSSFPFFDTYSLSLPSRGSQCARRNAQQSINQSFPFFLVSMRTKPKIGSVAEMDGFELSLIAGSVEQLSVSSKTSEEASSVVLPQSQATSELSSDSTPEGEKIQALTDNQRWFIHAHFLTLCD